MSFEEKLKKLEDLVDKLENDKIGFKESIEIYKEAKKLSKELNDELNDSINKLSYIVEDGVVRPLFDIENEKKDI